MFNASEQVSVSWDCHSKYMEKTCDKPPTKYLMMHIGVRIYIYTYTYVYIYIIHIHVHNVYIYIDMSVCTRVIHSHTDYHTTP